MAKMSPTLVVVDFGSWRTKAAVLRSAPVELLGIGAARAAGVRAGRVDNARQAAGSAERAVLEAEGMAGVEAGRLRFVLAGGRTRSLVRVGMAPVSGGQVCAGDVVAARRGATAAGAGDEVLLAALPVWHELDGRGGILEPLGLAGACLRSGYHLVLGSGSDLARAEEAAARLGLPVEGLCVGGVSAALGASDEDERELGVAVSDCGAETTSVAVWVEGTLAHTGLLPFGGEALVRELAYGLRVSRSCAAELLVGASVDERSLRPDETFTVPGVGARPPRELPGEALTGLLRPVVDEAFAGLGEHLGSAGVRPADLGAGVVLVGGTARLRGWARRAAEVLGLPARVGSPRVAGLTGVTGPEHAAVVGAGDPPPPRGASSRAPPPRGGRRGGEARGWRAGRG